jgi:DNA (cytosine-5)-methyltransferase 1
MGRCSRGWRQGGEPDRGRRAERIGSLFSGIGGLERALESLGMRTTWQVECDGYARSVLWQHWPLVPKYEDVCAVGAAHLCPVDVICGGFPCHGISDAGLRLGLDDPRSGLWREFARIVRELRPRYVFVENVAALRVRGLGRVLGDLAKIGYDAQWDCVRAADVGAPHLRNRLFILAYSGGQQSQGQSVTVAGGDLSAFVARDGEEGSVADADRESARRLAESWQVAHWWSVEPDVGRVAHGVPARMDRLRCLGNAVVPAQAAFAWRVLMRRIAQRNAA